MIHQLPDELLINVFSYVNVYKMLPFCRTIMDAYVCNVLWKPIVKKKFRVENSTNFYREHRWQQKLYEHQFRYKSQWTLGCVGRIIPPVKGSWPAAKF